MKKRFFIIYSILASIFILFSLSFLSYNLYKEYKEGESRTCSIFANTVFNLYSDLADDYSSGSEFYQNISASAGSLQDYSFYEIQKNGKIIYSYPGNIQQKDTSSKLTKNFSTIIEIEDIKYMITCNIYLLKPYSIFYYSKITFLMILGITLLTFLLILFTKEKPKVSNEQFVTNLDLDEEISETENNDNNTNESDEVLTEINTDNLNNTDITLEPVDNNTLKENENKSEPEGLFSTLTGFGWESYLITRLNNEINRAIASEMDISLFIIKLSNLERENILTKKICDYIATQFQFRDLLFEYKDNCIVAIKTGDNLEEALTFADKLHNDISILLSETDSKCYIGITTRSVRMISAERFINEAEQALIHAEEDDNNPIIAFKADIEKYRKYVEQQYDN